MVILAGFLIVFFAGSIMGTNLVPLKWIRVWKWENFWFVYSIMSLLIVPICIAFIFVPHLGAVYSSIPVSTMAKPFLYGVLWGAESHNSEPASPSTRSDWLSLVRS